MCNVPLRGKPICAAIDFDVLLIKACLLFDISREAGGSKRGN